MINKWFDLDVLISRQRPDKSWLSISNNDPGWSIVATGSGDETLVGMGFSIYAILETKSTKIFNPSWEDLEDEFSPRLKVKAYDKKVA
jgi:hypothetical protein